MTLDAKVVLQRYLQSARDALIWKLDGLSEYDSRRPLVPTGTNLVGLVKHVASMEAGYLGEVFGRPFPEPLPWLDEDAEPDADMWAAAHESRESVVAFYHRVWQHSDATVSELPLDAVGDVAWWSNDRRTVSLGQILVHLIAETDRHAGHADIVRELIDGKVGLSFTNPNLPEVTADWRAAHLEVLERTAREAGSEAGA